MRINVYLRGIDLVDLEIHAGSRGVYLDLNWFKPRDPDTDPGTDPAPAGSREADPSGTTAAHLERAPQVAWLDDQPVVVRQFGFG